MAIVSDVEIRLRADIARLQQDLNRARQEVNGAINGMSQAVEKFKGLLGGLLAVGTFAELANQVIAAQREFDKLNSSLITATGSSKNAAQAFAALQRFAASTPYDLKQTTEAFLKLRNLGLTPSERALKSYGNTASAMGKDLLQLVEAVADAATGEFERLKEFGIKAKQNGDQVSLTFQGVTTNIKNNAADIEKYLIGLGETKFAGGMELQAKTLDGAISNLGDTWQGVLRTFSQGGFGDAVRSGVVQLAEALSDFTDYFKAASGEAKKNGEEIDKLGPLYQGLTVALRQAVIIATQLTFVFTALGRNIGAVAAGYAALFSGNFADADAIIKQRFANLGDEWEDVNKRIEAIDKAASERRRIESLQAVTSWGDELEQYKILGDAKAQQTDAEKKAAAEALAFYTKTREASIDQLQVLEQERDGHAALSSEEKKRVEILNDLLKFGKNLTAQQKNDIKGWADAIPLLAKYNKELEKSKALRADRESEAYNDVGAAKAQTQALQDQITYYGLTEEAVLKLKAAEIQRGIEFGYTDDLDRERMQGLLDATKEQIELQTKLSKMKAETTFWTDLESTARQTFVSIANGGKGTATRLKETFKNVFFDWLYQMTLKKWLISVQGTLTTTGAGAGGLLGTAGSLLGAASGASSVAGISGSIGSLAGIAGVLGSVGGIATGALQTAGALLTGQIAIGQTLSAGLAALGTGSAAGAVAGLSSLAGVLGPIGLGIAGGVALLSKAFGRGPKTVTGTSISGTLTPTGASAVTLSEWQKKGGWFSSTKRGTDTTAFTAEQNAALASTYKSILDVSKLLGDTIGVQTEALATRVQKLNISLTGLTEDQKTEALVNFFADVADTIAVELLPNLKEFSAEGETLSATLQRVVTNYAQVKDGFAAIGKSFDLLGAKGVAISEAMVNAAGGLEQLTSGLSYFQQNVLTDAERLALTQKQVTAAMTQLGYSSITTSEQFKAIVQGLDVSTKAGAELFVKLLAIAPAFKTVADAAEEAKKAILAAATQAANDALTALAAAIDKDKSTLAKAYSEATDAMQAGIDAASAKISDLRDLSDLLAQPINAANTPGQQRDQRYAARAEIAAALAIAKASGVLPSADSIRDAVTAVTSASTEDFTDMVSYLREQASIGRDLAGLGDLTSGQLSTAEKTLQTLTEQKDAADLAYAAEVERLDALLATNKEAVAAALGNSTVVGSIASTLARVALAIEAIKAASAPTSVSGTGSASLIENLYESVLGRQSDTSGLAFWLDQYSKGATLEQIRNEFLKSPEYLNQQAAASTTAVVTELQAMNARMSAIEDSTLRTALATDSSATSNAQLAQQFDQVSAGGGALLTENAKVITIAPL